MENYKICERCGEKFIPSSGRQKYCNRELDKVCPVCGNPYTVLCSSSVSNTCSFACSQKFVAIQRRNNAKKTTKICKFCGKPFHPNSVRDVYCYDKHYKTCAVCGKQFEIDPRKDTSVQTCSKECRYILAQRNTDIEERQRRQQEAFIEKYGVDNPMKIPTTVEKIKATNRQKYGTDWYMQTQEYKDRVKKTSQEKYGVDHFLSSKDVIDKRKQTCIDVYGVDNVFKSPEIKQHIKDTMSEKYGVENYGQTHVEHPDRWNEFKLDPVTYVQAHFKDKISVPELCKYLGVSVCSIYNYINVPNYPNLFKLHNSNMESEVLEILNSIKPGIEIYKNNRTIIHPYEIDIYLPEYSIGIECDPTYTHNSTAGIIDEIPKSPSYHKMKSDMCKDKGVFLFHIFGYEWTHKRDIIVSILRNLLGICDNSIYARKCKVKEVDAMTAKMFLNSNHRQGSATSSIRLGLYYNGELVSLMTFGKMRNTIGTSKNEDLSDCWELIRFCSKLNTRVVGGASKLLTHFIKMYDPTRIRSFSDNAHTKGTLYSNLRFIKIRTSEPGYMWVDPNTDKAYTRYNAQKQNIKKFLHDDSIDLSKSEREIMESHGFVRVFDSGVDVWEWNR